MLDRAPGELIETIDRIIELSNVARREGLLALEEKVWDKPDWDYEKNIFMLIIDGTDGDIVADIGITRYCADQRSCNELENLKKLLILRGGLLIQSGVNPRVIEDMLLSMVNQEIRDKYTEAHKDDDASHYYNYNPAPSVSLEEFLADRTEPDLHDNTRFSDKLLEYWLIHADDRSVQRLLRDVENSDLGVALKGLSGASRYAILSRMSERLAQMIAEDYYYMGPVRIVDVYAALDKIFDVLLKLIDYGEIVAREGNVDEIMAIYDRLFKAERESEKTLKPIRHDLETEFLELLRKDNRLLD